MEYALNEMLVRKSGSLVSYQYFANCISITETMVRHTSGFNVNDVSEIQYGSIEINILVRS